MAKHILSDVGFPISRAELFLVPPDEIVIRPGFNPREVFEYEDIKQSIRENGFYRHKPLTVKKSIDQGDGMPGLVLVDGEQRLRAVGELIAEGIEIERVPVIVERAAMSDTEQLLTAFMSATGKPLDCFEEANVFHRFVGFGLDVAEISRRTGKSETHVRDRIALVDASVEIREKVRAGQMPIKRAVSIVREADGDTETQRRRAAQIPIKPLSMKWNKRANAADLKMPTLRSENARSIVTDGDCSQVFERIKKEIFSDDFAGYLKDNGFDPNSIKISIRPIVEASK